MTRRTNTDWFYMVGVVIAALAYVVAATALILSVLAFHGLWDGTALHGASLLLSGLSCATVGTVILVQLKDYTRLGADKWAPKL